ncbi:MAG: type II toxin-antitoxin system RelE/ParE family toxin [Micrococcales bacterium]|nr:type II toxin-antitoxin system RelE/ParE family toxin [Micrococcales bacterium]
MSWSVAFAPSAVRGLERLPPRVATAVIEFVTATLPITPQRMSKELRGEFEGLRSARRGDYRVLFLLEGSTLLVVRAAHRSDAYRLPPPAS